eukprot:scaffold593_cov147-Skeletonema_menzelii.AAC.10
MPCKCGGGRKMEDSHDQKILHTLLLGVLRLYFERISKTSLKKVMCCQVTSFDFRLAPITMVFRRSMEED